MIVELTVAALVATSSICAPEPETPCEAALTVVLEQTTGVAKKRRLDLGKCKETLGAEKAAHRTTSQVLAEQKASDPMPVYVALGAVSFAAGVVITAILAK